jgi:hypothetical protein
MRLPVRRSAFVGFIAHSQHAHFALNRYIAEGRNGHAARAVRDDIHALEKAAALGGIGGGPSGSSTLRTQRSNALLTQPH